MTKLQVLLIHGGMTFKTKKEYLNYLETKDISLEKRSSWSGSYLDSMLGRNYQVIRPRMPLSDNASYSEWKILFERYLSMLTTPCILIGNSLGGIFLAKYLSEHRVSKKILGTYLVCPPFDGSLSNEDLCNGFTLPKSLELLEQNVHHVTLYFSQDDDVVPVSHAWKYRDKLQSANVIVFESKNGHFSISEFPEIIAQIKSDVRNCKKKRII